MPLTIYDFVKLDSEELKKVYEKLTIASDFIFSMVMRDKKICKKVLRVLLQKKLGKISQIEYQKSIDSAFASKGVRLDIYAEIEGQVYNIEMQASNRGDNIFKRIRFYQIALDSEAMKKGEDYDSLPAMTTIFICSYDPVGDGDYIYTYQNRFSKTQNLVNDGKTAIVFNTSAYKKAPNKELRELLAYLHGVKIAIRPGSLIEEIDNKVKESKNTQIWRDTFMEMSLRAQQFYNEWRAEGRAEGQHDASIKFARKLITESSFDDNKVSSLSELPIDEVIQLRSKLSQ